MQFMALTFAISPHKQYLSVAVTGEYVPYEALEAFSLVLSACSKNKLYKVLVDFRDVRGSVTTENRREFYASICRQHVIFRKVCNISLEIAFVGPAAMISKDYVERLHAEFYFLKIKSTTDIDEAFEWLDVDAGLSSETTN